MRPISTTNSIHESMLDQEKIRCRTWNERVSMTDVVHMVGGLGGLTKMEAKRRLDCQAWNLQSVTSAYACNGSESG